MFLVSRKAAGCAVLRKGFVSAMNASFDHMMKNSRVRFCVLVGILLAAFALGRFVQFDPEAYRAWIARFPPAYAGAVFIALYVGLTFFAWFAKDLLKIVGALSFGAYLSTLYIWIAELFNAAVLFHLSRALGRDFVGKRLGWDYAVWQEALAGRGLWTLFVLRAVPLVPYRLLDLFCGLTSIRFRDYFIIVFLGSPLRIFWIQLILAGVGQAVFSDPTVVVGYMMRHRVIYVWSLMYCVAAVAAIIMLKRKGRMP